MGRPEIPSTDKLEQSTLSGTTRLYSRVCGHYTEGIGRNWIKGVGKIVEAQLGNMEFEKHVPLKYSISLDITGAEMRHLQEAYPEMLEGKYNKLDVLIRLEVMKLVQTIVRLTNRNTAQK